MERRLFREVEANISKVQLVILIAITKDCMAPIIEHLLLSLYIISKLLSKVPFICKSSYIDSKQIF